MKFAVNLKGKIPFHSLKYMFHSHLGGPQPGRGYAKIHASELTKLEGFCPRFIALHDLTNAKAADEWITASLELTFEIGRMVQDRLIHYYADMGKAVGDWRCLSCNMVHRFMARPTKCSCGCKAFKPEEVRFLSPINGASCGIDMLVNTGGPKLTPVEIKTMNPEDYKALVAPLAEHKLRTRLYLRLIEECQSPESQMVDTQKARIIYVSKGGYGCASPDLSTWGLKEKFSPIKEFDVTRNDDAEIEELCKRAKVVKDFRAKEVGTPCGICTTAMTKRAMYCKLKGPCFSGDYPATYDWREKVSA